eukprot:591346-Rhodomonas_salina.1
MQLCRLYCGNACSWWVSGFEFGVGAMFGTGISRGDRRHLSSATRSPERLGQEGAGGGGGITVQKGKGEYCICLGPCYAMSGTDIAECGVLMEIGEEDIAVVEDLQSSYGQLEDGAGGGGGEGGEEGRRARWNAWEGGMGGVVWVGSALSSYALATRCPVLT